jgi:hypothetical protein
MTGHRNQDEAIQGGYIHTEISLGSYSQISVETGPQWVRVSHTLVSMARALFRDSASPWECRNSLDLVSSVEASVSSLVATKCRLSLGILRLLVVLGRSLRLKMLMLELLLGSILRLLLLVRGSLGHY